MVGIIYRPPRPVLPMVPHAMPWRCNLNANGDSARRLDWTWPICSEMFPFIGYIDPRQPAHQKIGSSGSFRVAAPQSAEQAVCAMGLANNATSGLMSAVSASSCHSGSRSEEHTSELQSLMRISYAVFCLKKK